MRFLAYVLAFAKLVCAVIGAPVDSGIQGQWKAQIDWKAQVKDAAAVDMLFQFSVGADGRTLGTFSIPQMGIIEVPITSVTVSGSEVQMQIGGLQSEFQGTLDASGTAIAGTLRRSGASVPMRLTLVKRTLDPRAEPKPAPKEVLEWFRSAAIPLQTTEVGHGFEDMRPLREVIGNARIVAMGEATHGTREFFQLKHRFLEFLVSEMGFSVFGIEANWPESLALNRYVLTGEGDPVQGLDGLHFWTCNSQEVLDMVRWMRRYNQNPAHTRKVEFFGFDLQFAAEAVRNVLAFLGRTDPDAALEFARAMQPLATPGVAALDEFRALSDDRRRQVGTAAAEFVRRFDRNKERYVARSSDAEWRLARQNAVIAHQAATLADSAERDRLMAENVNWILQQEPPGAKMMLWAHNGHVRTSESPEGWVPMGMHLRRMFGDAMVAIGFAFNQGEFRASEVGTGKLRNFAARPAPVDTLDGALTSTGLPLFVVDLRRAPKTGPVAEWLMQEHGSRNIGSTYSAELERNYQLPIRIAGSFDLLLFVERTSAAVPVPY